jgi:hypothetical protein
MSTVGESWRPTLSVPSYAFVATSVWAAALAFYVAGDTGSTIVSLELGGFESAVVAGWFLESFGYLGLVLNKLLVVGVCWLLWRRYPSVAGVGPDPFRLVIPVVMLARGVWLTVHNVGVVAALL